MGSTVYHTFEKTIGDTTYMVEYTTGYNTKKTVGEKVKKLILNNLSSFQATSLKPKMPVPGMGAAS